MKRHLAPFAICVPNWYNGNTRRNTHGDFNDSRGTGPTDGHHPSADTGRRGRNYRERPAGGKTSIDASEPSEETSAAWDASGTVLYMAPDFDAPLEDFKEYME